jgi:hypothetical protein
LRQHFGAQQAGSAQQVGSAAQQLGSGAQHEGSQQRWRWNASAVLAVRTNRPANNNAGNTMRDFMDGTPKQKLGDSPFPALQSANCLWRIFVRNSGKAVQRLLTLSPSGKPRCWLSSTQVRRFSFSTHFTQSSDSRSTGTPNLSVLR